MPTGNAAFAPRPATANAARTVAWQALAVALIRAGRLKEARDVLERGLTLEPRSADALNNLGLVLYQLGETELAVERHRRALEIDPDDAAIHGNLAMALIGLGRCEEALAHAARAIALKPEIASFYAHAAHAEAQLGRCEAALRWLDRVPGAAAEDAACLLARADLLRRLDRFEEGIAACRRALAIGPACESYNMLGLLLQASRRDHEALDAFDAAAAFAPPLAMPLVNKASLLMELGRGSEAEAAIAKAVALEPHSARVWYTRALLKDAPLGAGDLKKMQRLLAKLPASAAADRMRLHFALGNAFLDRNDGARAFANLNAANRLKRTAVRYDADEAERRIAAIAEVFSARFMAEARASDIRSELPVFVIGMPRSGTSLVEQILASHPEIHGAGELGDWDAVMRDAAAKYGESYPAFARSLPPDSCRDIGESYLARIAAPAGAARVVDKMMTNGLYAGLIHLALPRARIIRCRRDPLDTCLSCYSKLFSAGMEFTYDLAELGRYHVAHEALMAHWRRVLPAENFLEIDYESIVEDTEAAARRLVAFCGLPWSPACLSFHKTERAVHTASMQQVRKPIYRTSVARARQFREELAPLVKGLGEG